MTNPSATRERVVLRPSWDAYLRGRRDRAVGIVVALSMLAALVTGAWVRLGASFGLGLGAVLLAAIAVTFGFTALHINRASIVLAPGSLTVKGVFTSRTFPLDGLLVGQQEWSRAVPIGLGRETRAIEYMVAPTFFLYDPARRKRSIIEWGAYSEDDRARFVAHVDMPIIPIPAFSNHGVPREHQDLRPFGFRRPWLVSLVIASLLVAAAIAGLVIYVVLATPSEAPEPPVETGMSPVSEELLATAESAGEGFPAAGWKMIEGYPKTTGNTISKHVQFAWSVEGGTLGEFLTHIDGSALVDDSREPCESVKRGEASCEVTLDGERFEAYADFRTWTTGQRPRGGTAFLEIRVDARSENPGGVAR